MKSELSLYTPSWTDFKDANHILIRIFSCLDCPDIRKVEAVCKHWKNIVNSPEHERIYERNLFCHDLTLLNLGLFTELELFIFGTLDYSKRKKIVLFANTHYVRCQLLPRLALNAGLFAIKMFFRSCYETKTSDLELLSVALKVRDLFAHESVNASFFETTLYDLSMTSLNRQYIKTVSYRDFVSGEKRRFELGGKLFFPSGIIQNLFTWCSNREEKSQCIKLLSNLHPRPNSHPAIFNSWNYNSAVRAITRALRIHPERRLEALKILNRLADPNSTPFHKCGNIDQLLVTMENDRFFELYPYINRCLSWDPNDKQSYWNTCCWKTIHTSASIYAQAARELPYSVFKIFNQILNLFPFVDHPNVGKVIFSLFVSTLQSNHQKCLELKAGLRHRIGYLIPISADPILYDIFRSHMNERKSAPSLSEIKGILEESSFENYETLKTRLREAYCKPDDSCDEEAKIPHALLQVLRDIKYLHLKRRCVRMARKFGPSYIKLISMVPSHQDFILYEECPTDYYPSKNRAFDFKFHFLSCRLFFLDETVSILSRIEEEDRSEAFVHLREIFSKVRRVKSDGQDLLKILESAKPTSLSRVLRCINQEAQAPTWVLGTKKYTKKLLLIAENKVRENNIEVPELYLQALHELDSFKFDEGFDGAPNYANQRPDVSQEFEKKRLFGNRPVAELRTLLGNRYQRSASLSSRIALKTIATLNGIPITSVPETRYEYISKFIQSLGYMKMNFDAVYAAYLTQSDAKVFAIYGLVMHPNQNPVAPGQESLLPLELRIVESFEEAYKFAYENESLEDFFRFAFTSDAACIPARQRQMADWVARKQSILECSNSDCSTTPIMGDVLIQAFFDWYEELGDHEGNKAAITEQFFEHLIKEGYGKIDLYPSILLSGSAIRRKIGTEFEAARKMHFNDVVEIIDHLDKIYYWDEESIEI